MGNRRVLIHEWVAAIGGSEAVSIEILKALPGADFMALWIEPEAVGRIPEARETVLRHLPRGARRIAALGATPFLWRTIRTPAYDTVITSSHALGHTAKLRSSPDALYLSYVHSPARYVYSPELDPRGARGWMATPAKVIAGLDRRYSGHVDAYACNSTEVQTRVEKYWGRPSVVIHPPVDVDFYSGEPRDATGDFILSVGRLISYKRHDFAIQVGEAAGCPVRIIGTGPLERELREMAAQAKVPVEVITRRADGTDRPARQEIRTAMSQARALIFAAFEDFGIVPVEAAAVGLPVVGINKGGLRDSVIDGVTGFLLDEEDPAAFADALNKVDGLDSEVSRAHARAFSTEHFETRFVEWVDEQEGKHGSGVAEPR